MIGLEVTLLAYFLPRGMTRQAHDALGFDVLDLETKKLRPDPKIVRDAVASMKKLGFRILDTDPMMLTIGAAPRLLKTHFGVVFVAGDPDGPIEEDHFVKTDGSNDVVYSAKPLAAPLISLVRLIAPVPMGALNAPTTLPQELQNGRKIEPWHVWPDEIRTVLGGREKDAQNEEIFRHWQGKGARISLVDSGINTKHNYITNDLGIDTIDDQRANQLTAGLQVHEKLMQICKHFKALEVDFGRSKKLIDLLHDYFEQCVDWTNNPPSLPQHHQPLLKRLLKQHDIDPAHLHRVDSSDVAQEFYVQAGLAMTINRPHLANFLPHLTAFAQNNPPPPVLAVNPQVRVLLTAMQQWLDTQIAGISLIEEWAFKTAYKKLADFDGHGTMMAVSMLSVAPEAKINCNVTTPPAGHFTRLEKFVKGAERHFYYAALLNAIKDSRKGETYKEKIISNSWGFPFQTGTKDQSERDKQISQITSWKNWIETAINTDQFVICISSGNSGNPAQGNINDGAFASHFGAIVVGGAYKQPTQAQINVGFSMGDGDVYLSDAAHAYRFDIKKLDQTKLGVRKGLLRIPDVCALVGPDIIPPPGWTSFSPYVYLPGVGQRWAIGGGGTSSAAAQVAGVCALIRGRYPKISASEVKTLITENGPDIDRGTSYNKKTGTNHVLDVSAQPVFGAKGFEAKDFSPRLKLIDIGEVLSAVRRKMQNAGIAPADGNPL